MSQTLTLARPYARAAYQIARAGGNTAEWSRALGLSARLAGDPQVASVLGDPRLSREAAAGLVAPDDATPPMRSFLSLLAENGRLAVLPEISGLFEQARAEDQKIVRAKITSAAPLEQSELERLRASLVRRFGREVEVETATDASLIGGAVIDTGEMVIDGSLKGKLERMKAALAQ